MYGRASGSPAMRLLDDRLGEVDRQGEADAVGHARLGGRDADEVAVAVEDGATGVAGVDRRVGLDEVAKAAACRAASRRRRGCGRGR